MGKSQSNSKDKCKLHSSPIFHVCDNYPCISIPLCNTCLEKHSITHDQTDKFPETIKKQITTYELINDRMANIPEGEKVITKSKQVICQLYELLNKLTILEEEFNNVKKFVNELSIESTKALTSTDKFFERIAELSEQYNECVKNYKEIVNKNFLLYATEDISKIMMFIDYAKGTFHLVHINFKVAHKISLKSLGLKSYSGDYFIGGPSFERIENKVFFVGGCKLPVMYNDLVEVNFNKGSYSVTKLTGLTHTRYDIGTAIIRKNFLYAISGTIFGNNTEYHAKHVERYDISADKWTEMHSVIKPRSAPGVCTLNDRYIYIYGGQTHLEARLEKYDVLDDEKGWVEYNLSNNILNILVEPMMTILVPVSNQSILFITFGGSLVLNVTGEEIKIDDKFSLNMSGLNNLLSTDSFFLIGCYKAKNMVYIPYTDQKMIIGLNTILFKKTTISYI